MEPIHSMRTHVRHLTFLELALRNHEEFKNIGGLVPQLIPNGESEPEDRTKLYETGFSAIIFAGIAAESIIYDFSARYLGDSYVEAHLDKLDLVSKWIVVPRLVCGVEMQKDGEVYMLLKKLAKARNDAVHSKTRPPIRDKDGRIDDEKMIESILKGNREFSSAVNDSIRAIKAASEWLFESSKDDFLRLVLRIWNSPLLPPDHWDTMGPRP